MTPTWIVVRKGHGQVVKNPCGRVNVDFGSGVADHNFLRDLHHEFEVPSDLSAAEERYLEWWTVLDAQVLASQKLANRLSFFESRKSASRSHFSWSCPLMLRGRSRQAMRCCYS